MNVQDLLDNGQLKGVVFDGDTTTIEAKSAPQYHVVFEITDKRLKQKKKASVVYKLDVTVPQDRLKEVWYEIMKKLKELEAKATPESQE